MKYTILFCAFFATSLLSAAPEMVLVGDAGNAGKIVPFKDISKPYPRGGVNYPYRIAKAEVTNAEYAAFLNACAAKEDPYKLYNEQMKIDRTGSAGSWKYAAQTGSEQQGVNFVSRTSAARYCNYLTSGKLDEGPYSIAPRIRENGETHEAIVGYRDLTFADQPVIYFLPDMHEFYKAGWFNGKEFRTVTTAGRGEPSHYGIVDYASGLREWMDNKYFAGAPFALGAAADSTSEADLNTAVVHQLAEYTGNASTGFRVAATAPLQIGDRLNTTNNFFYSTKDTATLRIRCDAPETVNSNFTLELRDFANRPVWSKQLNAPLKKGINTIPVDLPQKDGYYELCVTPADSSFNGQKVIIPLARFAESVPEWGEKGNFGFTCHITRRERRYSFEEFDFDFLKKIGASQVRVDVGFNDNNGSQTVLKRIRAAGLNPLGILRGFSLETPAALARKRAENPTLYEKWIQHGVAPEFATYAEDVYQLVSAFKDTVRDWEVGNEPTYWNCLPEDYAQLLKSAHKAAKLADPTCNVMAGDLNAIHAPVFKVKGGDFCDSIATHIYGFYVPAFWGIIGKMRELNGWKNAAGIADKPVWITEIGGCTYSSIHMMPLRNLDEMRRYQAIHQPKVLAGSLAFGASKILPYNFRDVPVDYYEEEFGMIDRFGMPKPAVAAFRTTAMLLGDARFTGFVKGHSTKVGENAILAFKDGNGRDVLVAWRNDPYGPGNYKTPFLDMVRPAETVTVPGKLEGDAELFDLSGGRSIVKAENGKLRIPVSEYPTFVRGRFQAETETVTTAHTVEPLKLPDAAVKILPNTRSRSCDLMAGMVLKLAAGTQDNVDIHVYNLKNAPLSGTLRLEAMSNWREWPWKIDPAAAEMTIPADSMGSARFRVPVPKGSRPDQLFYLNAQFISDAGVQFKDTVVFQAVEKELALQEWITYAKGYKIAADSGQIKITWAKERAGFAQLYRRAPEPFAESAAALERDVVLPVSANKAGITNISLLFVDSQGEIFQLKQAVNLQDNKWDSIRFDASAILRKGVIIHNLKDGNKQVDFPVRLFGFNFDQRNADDNGSISVKSYSIVKPAPRWAAGDWTVYGEGYKLRPGKDASALVIERTPGGRAYASLFTTRKTILAAKPEEWPKKLTFSFQPETVGLRAVSFLVMDAAGETFQLKRNLKVAPGEFQQLELDLTAFTEGKGLISYGGNNDKKLDYPVRMLGFNFDFEKSDDPGTLQVNAPVFDDADSKNLSGGGGAANMD